MSSKVVFKTLALVWLLAHLIAIALVWRSPGTLAPVFVVNAVAALSVLGYAFSRAHYFLAARDWSYGGLVVFELVVVAFAMVAAQGNRSAILGSYAALGVHTCVGAAAVVFALTFRLTKLF